MNNNKVDNTISYIKDLYNDKLTDFNQEPFFKEYNDLIIQTGKNLISLYLMDIDSFEYLDSTIDYLIFKGKIDEEEINRVCNTYGINRSSLNLGKHTLEYIKKNPDDRIVISDFYLDTCEFRILEKPKFKKTFKNTLYFKKNYFDFDFDEKLCDKADSYLRFPEP